MNPYTHLTMAERKKIKERQVQGIKIAKENGRYKGRKRKYSLNDDRLQHAFELYREGLRDKAIEGKTGINRTTFKRYQERYNEYREIDTQAQ